MLSDLEMIFEDEGLKEEIETKVSSLEYSDFLDAYQVIKLAQTVSSVKNINEPNDDLGVVNENFEAVRAAATAQQSKEFNRWRLRWQI